MEEPIVTRKGGEWIFLYEPGVRIAVGSNVFNYRGSPKVEITITLHPKLQAEGNGRVYRGDIGLLSKTNVTATIKQCDESTRNIPGLNWKYIINDMCWRAVDLLRSPPPIAGIGTAPPDRTQPPFMVWPLLPKSEVTTLYGLGGTGKSFVATLLAMVIDNHERHDDLPPIAGLPATEGKSLYVDWETNSKNMQDRVYAISQGFIDQGVVIPVSYELQYLKAVKPLAEWSEYLIHYVEDNAFTFVVLDSATMALGGRFNDADAVVPLFQTLRSLGCTILIIDHHGKSEGAADYGPLGSVVKTNLSRSTWELRHIETPRGLRIGFYHRKINIGRRQQPFGLHLDFEEDDNRNLEQVTFRRIGVDDETELESGLSIYQRIERVMRRDPDGAPTTKEIMDDLNDAKADTVRKTLRRRFVSLPGNRWGRQAHMPVEAGAAQGSF